jgi:hypothetical protein
MVEHTIKRRFAGSVNKLLIVDANGSTNVGEMGGSVAEQSITFAWNGTSWFAKTWGVYQGANGWVTI